MDVNKLNHRGFSLIELMIAMAIFGIVLPLIYQAYRGQQKAHTTQQLAVEMQQNARSAITLMKREIRMAGFAPAATDGQDNDGDGDIDEPVDTDDGDYFDPDFLPGFKTANTTELRFTRDTLPDPGFSDGKTEGLNEDITYRLSGTTLMRDPPGEVLAYDIEELAFGYAADIDGTIGLDPDPSDPAKFRFYPTVTGSSSLSTIGAVKIWLLARTAHPIADYSDPTPSYQVGNQTIVPADRRYKRTLLVATVYCRN